MTFPTSGILGIDVGVAVDSIDFPVGQVTRGKDGREYVLCQANGVIAANDVVLISADGNYDAAAITLALSASARGQKCGVAPVAATDNQFIWVCVNGRIPANVLASAAANTVLNTTATAGKLDDDASVGSENIDGIVLEVANGGATAAVAAILTYPTVGATN